MTQDADVVRRALQSAGASAEPVLDMVLGALDARGIAGGTLLDVGCGRGDLTHRLGDRFSRYVGADVVRHAGFPQHLEFVEVDLDRGKVALESHCADVVVSLETIEHVENPRGLVRELARLAKPGGWVLVTTPNQLSLASKLSLVFRNEFVAFQEAPGLYPAHITALVEKDLLRIAAENGLDDATVTFSASGRVPFTPLRWPRAVARANGFLGRLLSDNVLLCARTPAGS
jgi:2-polyprenyl-3-methyl-5-hydroxy-6-metoxy-1,4-benzoquinol methylase